jgi:hypothetical protein
MAEVKRPEPVKLILGMISAEESLFTQVEERIIQRWGEIDFRSPILPFQDTEYYEKEMGANLKRKFLSFESLIDPGQIIQVKLFTNKVEQQFLYPDSSRRRLNLDPGYISLSKLVLATAKDFEHRIYLGRGIYAEITLNYKRGRGFQPWGWTYPDYRRTDYLDIFNYLHQIYHQQLRRRKSEDLH